MAYREKPPCPVSTCWGTGPTGTGSSCPERENPNATRQMGAWRAAKRVPTHRGSPEAQSNLSGVTGVGESLHGLELTSLICKVPQPPTEAIL